MAEEAVAREPDLIIGSWCGKKFRPERVAARRGFAEIPAVRQDLYEIKSSLILQPGPSALTDGLTELQRIIDAQELLRGFSEHRNAFVIAQSGGIEDVVDRRIRPSSGRGSR